MGRQRERGGRSGKISGPDSGFYPIASGTAELRPDRDNPSAYLLMVNGVESSHIDLSDPSVLEFEYMRWIASTILDHEQEHPGDPMRVLHLGAAACSLARYLIHERPRSQHLAVDSDAELARLVREWFDLPKAPALRIRVGDARAVTQALPDDSYSVVVRDVFAGAVTPTDLTTGEFTGQVRRVLRTGGLYLLNCADRPDLNLARAEAATVGAVFEHVSIIADPPMLKGRRRGNVILIGSDAPVATAGLARDLLGGAVPAQIWDNRRVREFARNASPRTDPPRPEPPPDIRSGPQHVIDGGRTGG
ncbi:spermidine synthase [Nakamurella panacisegetis]|uniref:Spermidine synthase n=1 Tax=Nakamurella panacisegetis TaxID=1090615 RepID=A0A1H0K0R2_9ACTN|nr:fused MFS/spermidine synthase [Nakamurella panacisegetis]SDO49506.1 spermidine synthase [Nakamurella panacisegetis]